VVGPQRVLTLKILFTSDSECLSFNYHPYLKMYYVATIGEGKIWITASPSLEQPFIRYPVYEIPEAFKDIFAYCSNSHPALQKKIMKSSYLIILTEIIT